MVACVSSSGLIGSHKKEAGGVETRGASPDGGEEVITQGLPPEVVSGDLLGEIRRMIEDVRSGVATAVNAALTMLYWRIGSRVGGEILKGKRAVYGRQIVVTLSRQLVEEFGEGYAEKNLRRMIQFATAFPDQGIVATLLRQLSWSHFVLLLPLKDPLQREFYAEMCRLEHWDTRTLRKKIDSMLYERTAISRKPEALAKKALEELREGDHLSPDLVFRDPYVLDFLNLKDTWSEDDLETAILRELEHFLLELGAGFTFVARQKRMVIDGQDFHLDLLFFHRRLKRLVAVELKLGRFKAAYKGQMELYLRWLEKHETETGEKPPLGLILCAEGNREQVELLQLDASGIHVAAYLTELPPKEVLQRKLHAAIVQARAQLEGRGKGNLMPTTAGRKKKEK
jgi:predicted nuclease of restriction endonuclease-like (RecB) superfamily